MDFSTLEPRTKAKTAILASIGHVCLQWSLLEMTVLGVIYALEDIPHERGAIIYGGLDMLPRFNMAINLARHHKAPPHIVGELVAIRKALQCGIAERRNQVVHGAHADTELLDEVQLTMVRWPHPKRTQTVKLEGLIHLVNEIHDLQRRGWRVFDAIGTWKFGDHRSEDTGGKLAVGDAAPRLKIAERLYTGIEHVRRWLKLG